MDITASDRKALIRLASSLPKGSGERKTILASLKTSNMKVLEREMFKLLERHFPEEAGAIEVTRALDDFLGFLESFKDQREIRERHGDF